MPKKFFMDFHNFLTLYISDIFLLITAKRILQKQLKCLCHKEHLLGKSIGNFRSLAIIVLAPPYRKFYSKPCFYWYFQIYHGIRRNDSRSWDSESPCFPLPKFQVIWECAPHVVGIYIQLEADSNFCRFHLALTDAIKTFSGKVNFRTASTGKNRY